MSNTDIENAIKERLLNEGGIFYCERINKETKEIKRYVNILGIELETYATPEDIDAVKKKILLCEVDCDILTTIAKCYKLRQPLLLQGDPGTGKTFLLKTFFKLIHGREADILEIYCIPDGKYAEVALIEAYSGRNGCGNILLIEHLDIIYPIYQTIFRQIGGDGMDLSKSIHFNGKEYRRGKDTWICFTCNFPEITPGCNSIEEGLADRLFWKVITDEDAHEKTGALIRTLGGRIPSALKKDLENYIKKLHISH
jgi:hypothetical protein